MVRIDLTTPKLIDAFFSKSNDVTVSEVSKIIVIENDNEKAKRVEAGQTISLDGDDIIIIDGVQAKVFVPKSVKPKKEKK